MLYLFQRKTLLLCSKAGIILVGAQQAAPLVLQRAQQAVPLAVHPEQVNSLFYCRTKQYIISWHAMESVGKRRTVSRFGKLVCMSGPRVGTEYELAQEVTGVGRAPTSHIPLEDQFASRYHAEVRRVENAYQVHDLQSKNGVFVDGKRLSLGGTAWLQEIGRAHV